MVNTRSRKYQAPAPIPAPTPAPIPAPPPAPHDECSPVAPVENRRTLGAAAQCIAWTALIVLVLSGYGALIEWHAFHCRTHNVLFAGINAVMSWRAGSDVAIPIPQDKWCIHATWVLANMPLLLSTATIMVAPCFAAWMYGNHHLSGTADGIKQFHVLLQAKVQEQRDQQLQRERAQQQQQLAMLRTQMCNRLHEFVNMA